VRQREIQTVFAITVEISMNFHLFDLIGFMGVLLIIIAYLLLQLEKLSSSSPNYSLMNAAGALLIIISLIFAFNLSAFIVEVFWFLISLLGIWRSLISRRNSERSRVIDGNSHP
jgi:predicted membrane protein